MSSTRDHLAQMLRESNPIPVDSNHALDDQDRARIERIVATGPNEEQPRGRPRKGRRIVRVAMAAAVAVGLFVTFQLGGLGGNENVANAATPRQLDEEHQPTANGARAQLLGIADRTEDLPNDVGTSGQIRIRTEEWSLFTRIDGEQVTSEVVPQQVTTEIEPDGERRTTTTYEHNGDEQRDTSTTDGAPVEPLADNLGELTQQFEAANPDGPRGRFNAVVEAHRETPAPPSTRAAVLEYLAATNTIKTVGKVRDRLGRSGIGFTVDSDMSGLPTRYMLVVDPQNGHLLGYEETLTKDAGKLNVDVPSVIQYTAWDEARYTS